MSEDPTQYEYKTTAIDKRPKKMEKELNKLAKQGWEVVSNNTRSALQWGWNKNDVTLRRPKKR